MGNLPRPKWSIAIHFVVHIFAPELIHTCTQTHTPCRVHTLVSVAMGWWYVFTHSEDTLGVVVQVLLWRLLHSTRTHTLALHSIRETQINNGLMMVTRFYGILALSNYNYRLPHCVFSVYSCVVWIIMVVCWGEDFLFCDSDDPDYTAQNAIILACLGDVWVASLCRDSHSMHHTKSNTKHTQEN